MKREGAREIEKGNRERNNGVKKKKGRKKGRETKRGEKRRKIEKDY